MAKSVDDSGPDPRMAGRDEGAYCWFVTDEQRNQPGCIGREGDRLSHSRTRRGGESLHSHCAASSPAIICPAAHSKSPVMKLLRISFVSMGAVLGLIACGGGGSASPDAQKTGAGFEPSLPRDRVLGTLTAAESAQLCQELQAFFATGEGARGIHELQCRSGAVLATRNATPMSDAQLQQACQGSYDTCKSSAQLAVISDCSPPTASCMATVTQFVTCASDTAEYFSELAGSVATCSELTLENLQSAGRGTVPKPQSCAALKSLCPDGQPLPGGT